MRRQRTRRIESREPTCRLTHHSIVFSLGRIRVLFPCSCIALAVYLKSSQSPTVPNSSRGGFGSSICSFTFTVRERYLRSKYQVGQSLIESPRFWPIIERFSELRRRTTEQADKRKEMGNR
ncbi:hypothetical protein EVAR_58141_1 [Eumeta japonica]|uniref:Uncharacterized protein n=1 Tax=Eumeta variegata TaxID=151549 RepID=A0A4C1YS83_EUMVA|nr:hypothetical protein EVAR_58141_1 [Eumeta japonica]